MVGFVFNFEILFSKKLWKSNSFFFFLWSTVVEIIIKMANLVKLTSRCFSREINSYFTFEIWKRNCWLPISQKIDKIRQLMEDPLLHYVIYILLKFSPHEWRLSDFTKNYATFTSVFPAPTEICTTLYQCVFHWRGAWL